MDVVIPILAIVAIVGGWNLFLYKQSGGRMWSPLWMAFSATAAAVFFAAAGLAGYTLDRHERFVAQTSWAAHVIWSQVGFGLLAAFVAVYFWRRALSGRRAN